MTDGGARAAVIGVETNTCCGIDPVGAPFLAVIDVASGEVASRIELPELRVGQPGDWLGSTDHLFGGQYVPELALSPDGTLAFVVHAEVDRVTVVNLNQSEVVGSHAFDEVDSMATRLGTWFLDRFARNTSVELH